MPRAADLGRGFDRVLVDPPCSDLGTLASRPDARWRKPPEQIARLAALQGEILARGAGAPAPGGTLVYSTCTISARENEERGRRLGPAARRPRAADPGFASAADSRCLQTRPDRDRTTASSSPG